MTCIQGGPFLEISFIFCSNKGKSEIAIDVLEKIEKTIRKFQCIGNTTELAIESFIKGTAFDDERNYHSLELDFTGVIGRERKGMLFFNEVADSTFIADLCFFGSDCDAPEWEQVGILTSERADFIELVKQLYNEFRFPMGSIAFENDALSFWNCEEMWPNSKYSYDNLQKSSMKEIPNGTIAVICNNENFERERILHKYSNLKKIDSDGQIIFVANWE